MTPMPHGGKNAHFVDLVQANISTDLVLTVTNESTTLKSPIAFSLSKSKQYT